MDIRNWPLDRIMQLPDWCFGRRWPVIFSFEVAVVSTDFFISEIGLPDVCVLWELFVAAEYTSTYRAVPSLVISLALGDQLPTTDAQFLAMENMFTEADELSANIRLIRGAMHLTRLRKPYRAQGRRIVLRTVAITGVTNYFSVGLVVSSIPTEVPDWLSLVKG